MGLVLAQTGLIRLHVYCGASGATTPNWLVILSTADAMPLGVGLQAPSPPREERTKTERWKLGVARFQKSQITQLKQCNYRVLVGPEGAKLLR